MTILTVTFLHTAKQHIAANDKTMAPLIARLPALKLAKQQPPFHVLATSIINQQLSQQAAAAIEKRIAALTLLPFSSAALSALSAEKLRQAGLSNSKAKYLHALAAADKEGMLQLPTLKKLSDREVITHLTAIHGIGKWTAEMFLMFCLRRGDILPLGDAGLLRAARRLYGKRYRGDDVAVLQKAARHWQPWRTVGCYYLWRSLDN